MSLQAGTTQAYAQWRSLIRAHRKHGDRSKNFIKNTAFRRITMFSGYMQGCNNATILQRIWRLVVSNQLRTTFSAERYQAFSAPSLVGAREWAFFLLDARMSNINAQWTFTNYGIICRMRGVGYVLDCDTSIDQTFSFLFRNLGRWFT